MTSILITYWIGIKREENLVNLDSTVYCYLTRRNAGA